VHICPEVRFRLTTSMYQVELCWAGTQVLPLPNIPLYYAGYKAWSARQGLVGCRALQSAFEQLDARQLGELRDSLRELGTDFPPDSWPAQLLRNDPRCASCFQHLQRGWGGRVGMRGRHCGRVHEGYGHCPYGQATAVGSGPRISGLGPTWDAVMSHLGRGLRGNLCANA
jgi:hypothetical protein